jgi:hypothetical protein
MSTTYKDSPSDFYDVFFLIKVQISFEPNLLVKKGA